MARANRHHHSGAGVAHNPSFSQEGISAEIRQRPAALALVAVRSQETLRTSGAQLCGDLQSHPPAGKKQQGDICIIREEPEPYNVVFDLENARASEGQEPLRVRPTHLTKPNDNQRRESNQAEAAA